MKRLLRSIFLGCCLVISFPTFAATAINYPAIKQAIARLSLPKVFVQYDEDGGYNQIFYKLGTDKSFQLTKSNFDKIAVIWGPYVDHYDFHGSQDGEIFSCVKGRLFYYLGDETSDSGTNDIYVGCVQNDLSYVTDFKLTSDDEADSFDIIAICRAWGQNLVYIHDESSHDAYPVVFQTADNDVYLLLHDAYQIYESDNYLKGLVKYFDYGSVPIGWDGDVTYSLCEEDEQIQEDYPDDDQQTDETAEDENDEEIEAEAEESCENNCCDGQDITIHNEYSDDDTSSIDININVVVELSDNEAEAEIVTSEDEVTDIPEIEEAPLTEDAVDIIADSFDGQIFGGACQLVSNQVVSPMNLPMFMWAFALLPLFIFRIYLRRF